MKKVALALLFIILIAGTIFFLYIPLNIYNSEVFSSNLVIDEDNNLLIAKENKDIKILQLSDVQINNIVEMGYSLDIVKTTIKKANPDLIVLTGDNLNKDATIWYLERFRDFMDSFEIPWALVYGNHDYDANISIETQNQMYESSKYGLFQTGYIEGYNGNYYYNIKRGDEVVYTLIFMDSHQDGFINRHVVWYESTINKITEENGKVIPSMMFFHIPIENLKDAYDAYLIDPSIGSGNKYEDLNVQSTNSNIYSKIKKLGSTKLIAYGHDHINSLMINYDDILFCYGLKTGRTSYYNRFLMGGVLYTIKTDNSLSYEKIYV